ncbi:MAG: hypothetical protein L0Y75_01535 [Acidobacteria bacterium]|nr:hypothetical protein [Acidobacteriota bacterium]
MAAINLQTLPDQTILKPGAAPEGLLLERDDLPPLEQGDHLTGEEFERRLADLQPAN